MQFPFKRAPELTSDCSAFSFSLSLEGEGRGEGGAPGNHACKSKTSLTPIPSPVGRGDGGEGPCSDCSAPLTVIPVGVRIEAVNTMPNTD